MILSIETRRRLRPHLRYFVSLFTWSRDTRMNDAVKLSYTCNE